MICYVIKVHCSRLFIKKFNAIDSDLCEFFDFILLFTLFFSALGFVHFIFIFLSAQFDLIDAALLRRFINLSRDDLIKIDGCLINFTQHFS